MTEDEAKEKWCPFARLGFSGRPGSAAVNRILDVDNPAIMDNLTQCIGSDCMAWRWSKLPNHVSQMQMITDPDKHSDTDGYCGLASKQ